MEYIRTFEEFTFFSKKDDNVEISSPHNIADDVIFLSKDLENILMNIKGSEISSLFLSLKNIDREKLLPSYANYLDVDKSGTLTYLDSRNIESETYNKDYFTHNRRQGIKVSKALGKILKPEYNIENQVEMEKFMNGWKIYFESKYRVEELIGKELLRAYNLTGEVRNGGGSCASSGYVARDRFDGLIKNPNNYSAFVVWEKDASGKEGIVGRRIAVKGIQTKTFGVFKRGQEYTLLNNFYGAGGSGSAVDMVLLNYAKNIGIKYAIFGGIRDIETMTNLKINEDIFRVKIENPLIGAYPPFDRLFINFITGEVTSAIPGETTSKGWIGMYYATPPKSV